MSQILRITQTDALSFTLFVSPIILFLMGTVPFLFGEVTFNRSFGRTVILDINSSEFYIQFAFVLLPFVILLYVRRVRLIAKILNKGGEVSGKIMEINFVKDRGYVRYEYKVGKVTYLAINRVMKYKKTELLTVGEKVLIYFNTDNPREAFIQKIYQ